MCDFFWQRMDTNEDLADIVRGAGPSAAVDTPFAATDTWQYPPEAFPLPPSDEFGGVGIGIDPFENLGGPLLHELAGTALFDRNDSAGAKVGSDGVAHDQKILLGEEIMKRPCNLFSRVLQISPTTAKAPPRAIKPSPQPVAVVGDVVKIDHGLQISSPRTPGIKRRKSQAKKVVCIPAPAAASSRPSGEVVPSDLWAWRKYGQKPIKGSPYPRGYYRCSSSKGCSARKQVERSRTDPNMLVITYTSEHNHPWPTQRNALAGSTRAQPTKTSKSSSPHHIQRPLKEELKETAATATMSTNSSLSSKVIKEEVLGVETLSAAADDNEFDRVFYNEPIMSELPIGQPDDFFADLAELDPDPMNLFTRPGFMGDKCDHDQDQDQEKESSSKGLDPIFINAFGWGKAYNKTS